MDIVAILSTAKTVVDLISLAIEAGHDIVPQAKQLAKLFKGEALTDDDRAQNRALEAKLRGELQEPLPPDDGTTTT